MRLHTGYFAQLRKYLDDGCFCISIAGGKPDWYSGVEYKKLAPKYSFFVKWKNGYINNDEYVEYFYNLVLKELDAVKVYKELKIISGNAKNIVLLCYEKPSDFCHRHIVADWFNEELDLKYTVEEYKL